MKVSLTFDNGPTPGVTEPILDVLRSYDVLATFFVIGNKLRDRPARALAERAAGEGHWIGNHTLDHEVPLGALTDPVEVRRQIDETEALMAGLAHPSRFFRPYGAGGVIDERLLGAAAVEHLQRGGFTCVLWNALPGDWRNPQGWVELGITQVAAVPWAVVALHDLPTGALPRLPEFLDRVGELGAELTHEFPDSCVPIRNGLATSSFPTLADTGNLD